MRIVETNLSQPGSQAESRERLAAVSAGPRFITGVRTTRYRRDIEAAEPPPPVSRLPGSCRRVEPESSGCPGSSRPDSSRPGRRWIGRGRARPAGKQRGNWAAGAKCVCVWVCGPTRRRRRRPTSRPTGGGGQAHVGPTHLRPGPPQPCLLCQAVSFRQEKMSPLQVERKGSSWTHRKKSFKNITYLGFFKNYCINKVWKENVRKNIFKLLQEYLLARCVLQSCHLKKGNAALTCLIACVKERQMVEFNLNILMSTTAACLCNHFKIDLCSQTAAENTLTSYCEVFAKHLKSKQWWLNSMNDSVSVFIWSIHLINLPKTSKASRDDENIANVIR